MGITFVTELIDHFQNLVGATLMSSSLETAWGW
jgi:hypothetical protein